MEFVFWSRVEVNLSRVEKFFTIIFERRQVKIPCLLECMFYFILTPSGIMCFFSLFQALISWNRLTFVILPGYTVVDTVRYSNINPRSGQYLTQAGA